MDEKFSDLVGKTLKSIEISESKSEMVFTTEEGERFRLYHPQNCCESVEVEDVCGDLKDLLSSPILKAEESTSNENPAGVTKGCRDSFTWTFYHLATVKGSVTIRWYGISNGYYSESVEFAKI